MGPNVSIHAPKAAPPSLLPVSWVNGKVLTTAQVSESSNHILSAHWAASFQDPPHKDAAGCCTYEYLES